MEAIVTEVVFDPSSQPLLDGLRVTVRGARDPGSGGTYKQDGQFHGAKAFTFRVEPGASYPKGNDGPVPRKTTAFRFETFPQSKAWNTVCAPPGSSTCFLGVGTGQNIEFDLYITTFYGTGAPAPYTLRGP